MPTHVLSARSGARRRSTSARSTGFGGWRTSPSRSTTTATQRAGKPRRSSAACTGQDFDAIAQRVTASGNPDDVVERLQELVDAGAEEIIVLPCGNDPITMAEQVLTELVPQLRVAPPTSLEGG